MHSMADAPVVQIITMGCAKNEVDSDKMRAALLAAGFRMVGADGQLLEQGSNPCSKRVSVSEEHERAGGGGAVGVESGVAAGIDPDVVIVNTCSFITEATQESIDMILAVAEAGEELADEVGKGAAAAPFIVVAGCMPARYGAELEEEFPEVAAFVSVHDEESIVETLCALMGFSPRTADEADSTPDVAAASARTMQAPYAYVKISDGCDRRCAFCTIPRIRGPYESRTAAEIIDEVAGLVAMGTREVILIGQDTGVWGTDLSDPASFSPLPAPTLAALLDHLARTFPSTWLRVMYLQPERTDDELLAVMSSHGNICNYLDIPLQHCSGKVIREMNRHGDAASYEALVRRIRDVLPGAAVRTTLIAGFPGETEDEFEELLAFVGDVPFDYAGVFEYSREEETEAGERDDQVAPEVAAERAQLIRDTADLGGFALAQAHVGEELDVLVCGIDDDVAPHEDGTCRVWGRTMFQAPDVDGVVYVDAPSESVGSFIRVRITESQGYDLEGSIAVG